MDTTEKEVDFMRINEQLDADTEQLLKQLSDVRKLTELTEAGGEIEIADNSSAEKEMTNKPKLERPQTLMSTPNIGANISQQPKLQRHKSEVRMRDRLDNNLIPESVKGMGQEGIMRFLKAKVQVLTEQLETVQKDEKKLIDKVKDLQGERDRVSEDRDRWIQQANSAKTLLMKHEQHVSDIVVQLQSNQAENGFLKKEVEKLKKELKQTTHNASSSEVRLNRAHEEVEKLRTSLRQIKQEEKDAREGQKKKIEDLSSSLKRIEKQKVELLHAFKKQLAVIDGLKKQRGLAEAGKLLKNIEEDFLEFLDWSPNKV